LKILKYWPSSRDFNKLVIKAKMHANTHFWNFLCYMKIQYEFFIYIFERLGRMHENKKNIFLFWRKPGILIPDLYLYSIKIQTDIDQNTVKYFGKIIDLIFLLGPARPVGRGWTPQAWLGHWTKLVTRINNLKHAWISSGVHGLCEGN